MDAEILVTEAYPGAAAHTVLLVRPDGHLVTALSGVRPAEMAACANAVRGGAHGPVTGGGRAAGRSGEAERPPGPGAARPGRGPGAVRPGRRREARERESSAVDPVGSPMLHSGNDRSQLAILAEGPSRPGPLCGLHVSSVLLIRLSLPARPPASVRQPRLFAITQDGFRARRTHPCAPACHRQRRRAQRLPTPRLRPPGRHRPGPGRLAPARPRRPYLAPAGRAGRQRGLADRLAARHRHRLARPRRLARRLRGGRG